MSATVAALPAALAFCHAGTYAGDTRAADLPGGLTARVTVEYDHVADTPWEREDGHGSFSEWTRRDKRPGERVLCDDHGARRYYDFAAAVATARADGWDAPPYGTGTPGQRAARAAEADFARLRAWCRDDWCYVGLVVTIYAEDVELASASLWGIDSDSDADYFNETIAELLAEAMAEARPQAARIAATLAAVAEG